MSLPTLRKALQRVRTRARLWRLVAVVPWALATGLSIYAIAVVSDSGGQIPAVAGTAAYLIVTAGSLLIWDRRRPLTDARLARLLDERLDLMDLLSTAQEVDPRANPVTSALVAQAEARARVIYTGDVVMLRVPRVGLLSLTASLLLAIGSHLAPVSSVALNVLPDKSHVSAEHVLGVASLAKSAANMRRDPHMSAVARALEDLATESESGSISDTARLAELLHALDRLSLPGAREPLLAAGGRANDVGPHTLETVLTQLEERLTRQATLTGLGEEAFVFPEENWQVFPPSDGTVVGDATQLGSGPTSTEHSQGGPPSNLGALDELAAEGQDAPADLIGASSQSSAGGSSMAGLGTQDLLGDPSGDALPQSVEVVTIEGAEAEDGRRVSMELAPKDTDRPLTPEELDFAYGQSRDLPLVTVTYIPQRFGVVAGVYFLPSQETVKR
jgi:hypothetical protein